MIGRAESRTFLILLTVFSVLSLFSSLAALVLSYLWHYIGFLMTVADYPYICSSYQALKLQSNLVFNFNAIFVGACVSILFQLLVTVHLVYLLVKYAHSHNKNLKELSPSAFARLYCGYSLGLLGLCISVGWYGCYVTQYGWQCLGVIPNEWLILGSIFAAALVFLLICWIILVFFWTRNRNKIKLMQGQDKTEQSYSSGVEQPVNMIGLFETLKEALKKQTIPLAQNQIKQPLFQQSLQSDESQVSKIQQKQRLQIVTFEEYQRREEERQLKEEEENQLLQKLMKQQDQIVRQQFQRLQAKMRAMRIRKQNLGKLALSPNDPRFNEVFYQSEEEEEKQKEAEAQHNQQVEYLKKGYFPAGFAPKNDKQRADFEKYKKQLLKKHKKNSRKSNNPIMIDEAENKDIKRRHPQNIEGGRSRKQIERFIKQNKKPSRNRSIYAEYRCQLFGSNPLQGYIDQISQQREDSQQKSAQFKQIESQAPQVAQQPQTPNIIQALPNVNNAANNKKQQDSSVLCFHKPKIKSQSRKKLFQEQEKYYEDQAFEAILNALVKGVEQVSMRNKLKQLRQKRLGNQDTSKSKYTSKLIQSIRFKLS